MKRTIAGIALALVLAGCSSAPAPAETPTATATESVMPEKDLTNEVKAIAKDVAKSVTKAVETEPNRIVVDTSIVDPRGDDGSRPALEAVRLCNLIVQNFDGVTNVKIQESDGTAFAVYGAAIVNNGKCGEY